MKIVEQTTATVLKLKAKLNTGLILALLFGIPPIFGGLAGIIFFGTTDSSAIAVHHGSVPDLWK
ncbi:hypothetical protein [Pseudanabaena sp. PCC 6802]|uniref:hypothetical protein n=1 Tax=Pseudanabaena sp. PCC 6802 TaxID=118173 RepID=UPI000349F03F|nr:hypothetical protein [Pseudanabaena sp. PCC 6802]